MSDIRIFSYLPSPRIWKATIAARLCGVTIEMRGAPPNEIANWLWDFDARPLSEHEQQHSVGLERRGRIGLKDPFFKTDAFLTAHPFGTVPAAFNPDGRIGIFESNSIMRLVARLGEKNCSLYGHDAYETSRIDSFLDASLVFARDAQVYLLALREASITEETHARASVAFATFASGIEQALSAKRRFLVGESITLADICLVADLSLFMSERRHTPQLRQRDLALIFDDRKHADYPRAMAHLMRLADHPAFAPAVASYLRGFGFYHEDAKQ